MRLRFALYSDSENMFIIGELQQKLKSYLENKNYGEGIQNYIIGIICMSPKFEPTWKVSEKKYSKAKKLLEYDIILDFSQFESATEKGVLQIFAGRLINSLGVIEELKIKDFDAGKFKEDLIRFFDENRVEWDKEPEMGQMPISPESNETGLEQDIAGNSMDMLFDIGLMIHGFKVFDEEHFAEEFFGLIQEANKAYLPERIGVEEPLKIPFSMEAAKKVWLEPQKENEFSQKITFQGANCQGSITWRKDNWNFISLTLSRELVFQGDGIERLLQLAKKLFLWANGVYGFSAFGIDYLSNFLVLDFKVCLGGISWLTLFGLPYVEMFGKEVIQTAPCKVEEFADNNFVLLTSEVPTPIKPELVKIQNKVKKHLGTNAFCGKNPPRTIEDFETLKDKFRSPDFPAHN